MQRCINNLIDNAKKYAKEMRIKIEKLDKNIIILLEDDGPGIPKLEYENVF